MALALPKLRWLVIGAIAAGVWVVHEDMKGPRPPERVPTRIERSAEAKPRPPQPVAAKPAHPRQSDVKPVPATPIPAKPIPSKPLTASSVAGKPAPEKTALVLPKSVDRPPAKPQKIVTGSIAKPGRRIFVQTKTRVRVRAQAKPDAAVIATFEPRTVVRELARSGEWRLVMGDGRKGWVRADYLAKPPLSPRRPKLPIAEIRQATR